MPVTPCWPTSPSPPRAQPRPGAWRPKTAASSATERPASTFRATTALTACANPTPAAASSAATPPSKSAAPPPGARRWTARAHQRPAGAGQRRRHRPEHPQWRLHTDRRKFRNQRHQRHRRAHCRQPRQPPDRRSRPANHLPRRKRHRLPGRQHRRRQHHAERCHRHRPNAVERPPAATTPSPPRAAPTPAGPQAARSS